MALSDRGRLVHEEPLRQDLFEALAGEAATPRAVRCRGASKATQRQLRRGTAGGPLGGLGAAVDAMLAQKAAAWHKTITTA